jgi:predicted PurR-regulated permease PerM
MNQDEAVARRYHFLAKGIFLAAGLVVLLWFLHEIRIILLVLFLAVVLSIVCSAPVTWMETKGLGRRWGALIFFLLLLLVLGLFTWLIVPRLYREASSVLKDLPETLATLKEKTDRFLGDYPQIQGALPSKPSQAVDMLPSAPTLLGRIGSYSVQTLGVIAGALVIFAITIYAVINPRPLLDIYLRTWPPRLRDQAATAFSRASTMVIGWMWSNIIVGAIEAVLVGLFLTYMQIPAALLWAALAFFSELIPKVGAYIMAAPPVLIALSVSPETALAVVIFYMVMNELMGDLVVPRIRASTMDLHPVSVLFVMLVMAAGFGVVGALIATPITAFIKAYYEEFYLRSQPTDPHVPERIEQVLHRRDPRSS